MVRGTTLFRCSKCGKLFLAPDIEYGATVLSVPQHCKRCSSIRTLPLLNLLFISIYKKIWDDMKNKK